MSNPSWFGGGHSDGATNLGVGATGSSTSEKEQQFVGLGGVRSVPFWEGLQQGGSVVTAASTGNALGGRSQMNPVFTSILDLPVPKEILEAMEALGYEIQTLKNSVIKSKKDALQELKQALESGQAHDSQVQATQRDIGWVKMELHELENESRRSAIMLESVKTEVDNKKRVIESLGLSLSSSLVVRHPDLLSAACFESVFSLMADCRERLSFISKWIANAEQVYGHLHEEETTMSLSDLVSTLEATKDLVARLSAEVQLIWEACAKMSLAVYK